MVGAYKRRHRDERGAVIVEFALIFPIMIMLVFGLIDFAFMMNRDTSVNNASRDGVRVASLNGTYKQILDQTRTNLSNSGVAVTTPGTKITICFANDPSTTSVCDPTQPGFVDTYASCQVADNVAAAPTCAAFDNADRGGKTAVVTVRYLYQWITPGAGFIAGSGATLKRTAQMRIEAN